MPQFTASHIEELCDNWCTATSMPDGGMQLGLKTEKYRLLANNIKFHELNHETLCAALIGLTKVLLRRNLNTVIDQDHIALWGWCGELLLNPLSKFFPFEQNDIKSLCETSIRAALANCSKPGATDKECEDRERIQRLQPYSAQQFLEKSRLVLAYIGFPLLEAVLKRACAKYVSFDGIVITQFSVPNRSDQHKIRYSPNGSGKKQCSSLRDLLFLHSTIAAPELKALIEKFRNHLSFLDTTQDPFDLLYHWRNASLHGSASFGTIGGTLLNLSLLILIFDIKDDFEAYRSQASERWHRDADIYDGREWMNRSFYPSYYRSCILMR